MSKINDLPPQDIKFGHDLLPYFALDPKYTMINSGAHGVTPNFVLAARNRYYRDCEANPDQFFFGANFASMINDRREIAAKKLNCETSEIALIENATEAINTVLKSIRYKAGDVILVFDTVYRMVEQVSRSMVDKYNAELVIMPTNKEVLNSEELIIKLAEEYIEKYKGRIKIVSIDHISANPAIIFPIKKLIKLFRENNIVTLIDASHAIGQVKIDLSDIEPDFYVTNFHKWAYCAKSSSVLYARKDLQSLLIPAIVSHSYKSSFANDFCFVATRDYSATFSLKEGFEFMERIDETRMREYCHDLAVNVCKEVSTLWKTEPLVTNYEMIGNMVNVLLPYQGADTEAKLGREFCDKYNTYVKLAKYEGKYYARFCCQIFNEMKDFIYVAEAISESLNVKGI